MSAWSDVVHRVRALVRGAHEDTAHQDEVRFHLDMLTARHEAQGLGPDEARRRAHLEFGAAGDIRERAREQRGAAVVDDLLRDLRHGIRQLRSRPVFTLTITATLALAIGTATAVFSAADRVLLRPAPYTDAASLVAVWETDSRSGTTREPGSLPDYLDLRSRARTLAAIEGVIGTIETLSAPNTEPARISGLAVTGGWFQLFDARPSRGRLFSAAETSPGGARVALISESLWRARFNARDDIVGQVVSLSDVATEIVGVVPDDSDFGLDQLHDRAAYHSAYEATGRVDLWLPLQATVADLPRETHPLLMIGRIARGSSVSAAQAEVTTIMRDLEAQYPENTARGAFVESFEEVVLGPVRPLFALLAAAAALLALVATVNVANLLLVHGTSRAREVALRGALGASGTRLGRQFAAESALLVTGGAVAGLGLAALILFGIRLTGPASVPRLSGVALDPRSIAVAVAMAGVVGAVFSLLPALAAFRNDPMAVLKGEAGTTTMTKGGQRLRNVLVIAQLALCVTLAVCSGLVIRSFVAVLKVDPGFSSSGVVKAEYELPASRYPRDFSKFPNFTEITQFTDRVLAAARAVPGVEAAAIAGAHPLDEGFTNSWRVVGREAESADWPEISVRLITPGYPETMGLQLQHGRNFGAGDVGNAAPVALINATTARRFFAGVDPIGQQISFWGMSRRIVGVVKDERIHGLTAPAPPATYIPFHQAPGSGGVLLVRSRRPAEAVVVDVRRLMAATDPQLATFGLEPFSTTLGTSVGQRRFAVTLMSGFAFVTCLLVLVGVQGVVSYTAAQRTREIGIRQALGASRAASASLILRGLAQLVATGLVLGVAGALAGSGLLGSLLFGVSRLDAVTFVGAPLMVGLVAVVAGLVPAWRATLRAPLQAIREI